VPAVNRQEVVVVQATVRMVMNSGELDRTLRMFQSIAERTRVESGCATCSVYRDIEDKRVIVFEELWRSEEELRRHLASEEYRNVLILMEMSSEPPMVRFDTITQSTGMETIESARAPRRTENSPDNLPV
jgi:quinol monooxygenase YgiN